MQKLLGKLGNKCSGGDEQSVIMALKAIGNVGHVRSAIAPVVQCVKNQAASDAVRVAAVQVSGLVLLASLCQWPHVPVP